MDGPDEFRAVVEGLHGSGDQVPGDDDTGVECGNQHSCTFDFTVPALDRTFNITVKGSAMSQIIGFAGGPRPLVWKTTQLEGDDPELGHITVTLDPERDNAGTLVPLTAEEPFPAINRNNYYFVVTVSSIGALRSRRPAIVEGTVDGIPPNTVYRLRNSPIEFFLSPEEDDDPIAVFTVAETRVGSGV
jgi:hypothetical protein